VARLHYGYISRKYTVGLAGLAGIDTDVSVVEFGQVTQLLLRPVLNEFVCTSSRQPL
jgi:hypothetical protein